MCQHRLLAQPHDAAVPLAAADLLPAVSAASTDAAACLCGTAFAVLRLPALACLVDMPAAAARAGGCCCHTPHSMPCTCSSRGAIHRASCWLLLGLLAQQQPLPVLLMLMLGAAGKALLGCWPSAAACRSCCTWCLDCGGGCCCIPLWRSSSCC